MGFASPAADYVERQLTPEILCNMGADSRVLETDMGFAVIEPVVMKTTAKRSKGLLWKKLRYWVE